MYFLGWTLNSSKSNQPLNHLTKPATWQNPAKASFIYQQWTPIVDKVRSQLQILWASFKNKYFKKNYFDTSISNYLSIDFLEYFPHSFYLFKGALPGLRQFLATKSSLKMNKSAFYSNLKAPFVLKIFKLLYLVFGHVEKRLD